jgi:hypothetical protein
MKTKKTIEPKAHDLRDDVPAGTAHSEVVDQSPHLAPLVTVGGPHIVEPGKGAQVPGQTTHE